MSSKDFAAKQNVDAALEALRVGLAPYVAEKMEAHFGEKWRQYASIAPGKEGRELDTMALLKTMVVNFGDVFRNHEKMRRARSYVTIAQDGRHKTAHFDGAMPQMDALNFIHAAYRLLKAAGAEEQAKQVHALYEEQTRAGMSEQEGARQVTPLHLEESKSGGKLRPWLEVVRPHADVRQSHFTDAHFAADLGQVDAENTRARDGEYDTPEEYRNAQTFFEKTYLTQGLQDVLQIAIRRLSGKGGEPVIGLQTNFGGGKTHTMLAIYHLARSGGKGGESAKLHGVKALLDAVGVADVPAAKVAVFSGTHKGPDQLMHTQGKRKIRTVWGYLAWRLGGWKAYNLVADSDAAMTNPGSDAFKTILRDAGPCVILMDELVSFAKQMDGIRYEALLAFFQSLTEAASGVAEALVVGSLPESKDEAGGEAGQVTLDRLEKLFGRKQSEWTPAQEMETFEIVRRRLFEPLDEDGEKARDAAIAAFAKMYRDNAGDFPPQTRERAYREEMRHAYPIHPEVLKHFSESWSVLEKFQRTRGILKIMASAIYRLWREQSADPFIMLGALPLHENRLRSAILFPLDNAYGPILQSDVDGDLSLPAQLEAQRPTLGEARAATRAARAVFLATAPHGSVPGVLAADGSRGGLSDASLLLACAMPGEQAAVFGESLRALSERAAYLYHDNGRYWFSVRPTLNKLAAERASRMDEGEVRDEIVRVIREERQKDRFHRVHAAPEDLLDVEDRRDVALVILSPDYPHTLKSEEETAAERAVIDTLQRRGSGQRQFRNTLIFVAPDEKGLNDCREIARRRLGWKAILDDADMRDELTPSQRNNAENQKGQAEKGLEQRVRSVWSHVLYPVKVKGESEGTGTARGFDLEHQSLINRAPGKPIAPAVYAKLANGDVVADALGRGALARALLEVGGEEKSHVAVADLIDWFASYPYLQRLRDKKVLTDAVLSLFEKEDTPFAYAEGFDEETGEYRGVELVSLRLRNVEKGLLVWKSALPEAERGVVDGAAGEAAASGEAGGGVGDGVGGGEESGGDADAPVTEAKLTRFQANFPVGTEAPDVSVGRIAREILEELRLPEGGRMELSLEVVAIDAGGFPKDVVEVVRDNIVSMGFKPSAASFEAE